MNPDPMMPANIAAAAHAAAAAAAATHATLVAALRRPGACVPGSQGEAGLIQTHLSSLLLVGQQVFKLKRPLHLGFVDFRSLSARQAACHEELRLNRRTAPQLYLGVVPVLQTEDGPRLGALGAAPPPGTAVIDYAVQMRRFDDRQLFEHLADSGQLGAAEIDSLAEVVGGFHAQLSPAPAGFGSAAATRQMAVDNAAELAAAVAGSPCAGPVAGLQQWILAQAAKLAPLMDQRRLAGRVRELHGDLHLGNIVWLGGRAVLFDALEFSAELRCIDTLGDLAFTFMDLLAHGQRRLAWRFISAALEQADDHAALPLLPFWAVHRAAVRAKVALLGATGPGAAAQQARAQRYLATALALAGLGAVRPAPRLVLTVGLSGSGKSTVAGAVAERLGAVRLRSDVERKRLFGVAPTTRGVPGLYSADATHRTYLRLQGLAATVLQAGLPVVVDAASLRRSERDAMRAVAARCGVPCQLLLCEAPAELLQQRLQQRLQAGTDASDATPAVLAMQQRSVEWPGADELARAWRLDTARPRALLMSDVEALPLG